MRAMLLRTRLNGVPYARHELKQTYCVEGELEIIDTRENSYNRIIKIARLTTHCSIYELYEVHILWLNGDKMCLSGFERVKANEKIADYAQSWICLVGDVDKGQDNVRMMPINENFRH